MDIRLVAETRNIKGEIKLNASKSESNRALIINALSGNISKLHNLSNARDTDTMQRLLGSDEETLDVLDAGTTMRFLTAYSAVGPKKRILTGTPRMQQRPIKLLADALVELGAHAEYLKNEGYPPHSITPLQDQKADTLTIPGNISSQYISALLMIAPTLPKGLEIVLEGEIYSRPYIEMTLALMKHFGVDHDWSGQVIKIAPQKYESNNYTIESDWSGASYWYSLAALSDDVDLKLLGLRENSTQGDQEIASIMEHFGVKSEFSEEGVHLTKTNKLSEGMFIDFRSCPDLAQTVMACAAIKGIKLSMTGLESLKIKETDRIAAMQNELSKFGAKLIEDEGVWTLEPGAFDQSNEIVIETYEDHRMAMAFAPLSLDFNLLIEEREVVNKSYPDFWRDLEKVGLREADSQTTK